MDIQILVVEDTVLPAEQPDAVISNASDSGRVVSSGQRVRIRLCDTRLDSGIGDEKHSQESQPSSSGPYEPSGDTGLDQVVVHMPELS